MKKTFQWKIEIYCVTNLYGFGYYVEIDGQIRFEIDQYDANDCTEVMGIVGNYIREHGFPDRLVTKREIQDTISSYQNSSLYQ